MFFKSSAEGVVLPPNTANKYAATTFISTKSNRKNNLSQSISNLYIHRERARERERERERILVFETWMRRGCFELMEFLWRPRVYRGGTGKAGWVRNIYS